MTIRVGVACLLGGLMVARCGAWWGEVAMADARTDYIASFMTQPHEARPNGVPTNVDWGNGPRTGRGNTPPGDWTAFTAWGQVYQAEGGNPSSNTRVELADHGAFILTKSGKWLVMQKPQPVDGGAYPESFVGGCNSGATAIRALPNGNVLTRPDGGCNYHFWPREMKVPFNPSDIEGVVSYARARLTLEDPNGQDDRDSSRLLLSMGADYYKTFEAFSGDWNTAGDAAIGRFVFVKRCWQMFYMTTMSKEALAGNPPPLVPFTGATGQDAPVQQKKASCASTALRKKVDTLVVRYEQAIKKGRSDLAVLKSKIQGDTTGTVAGKAQTLAKTLNKWILRRAKIVALQKKIKRVPVCPEGGESRGGGAVGGANAECGPSLQ